jgi:integrase
MMSTQVPVRLVSSICNVAHIMNLCGQTRSELRLRSVPSIHSALSCNHRSKDMDTATHIEVQRQRLALGTVKRAEFHLRAFFRLDRDVDRVSMPYAESGGMLEDLQPRTCEELYTAMVKTCAVDTHRNALAEAKAFGGWCVKQGWIPSSPLAGVTAVGQRNRGKKQLRIDEARKLVDVCLRKANQGDEAAVGALTAFLLGLRASEVTDRVVRDLDDDGRLLWVDFGKTKRSRRTLEVPAILRPYLLALAEGRPADAQLISRTVSRRSGKSAIASGCCTTWSGCARMPACRWSARSRCVGCTRRSRPRPGRRRTWSRRRWGTARRRSRTRTTSTAARRGGHAPDAW